ncbi:hypothetical protein Kpho02_38850 [Kitasatospora phosalacinea]|uniref:Uncharacterized protein n=1 Tax=Kitasatospora phosalacinea TaxID=2065 RepID=A0A9W6QAR7_9ACTN|nr:hypothetical protein Kpho02_38850 [Kitasatospora phosalacinea]
MVVLRFRGARGRRRARAGTGVRAGAGRHGGAGGLDWAAGPGDWAGRLERAGRRRCLRAHLHSELETMSRSMWRRPYRAVGTLVLPVVVGPVGRGALRNSWRGTKVDHRPGAVKG